MLAAAWNGCAAAAVRLRHGRYRALTPWLLRRPLSGGRSRAILWGCARRRHWTGSERILPPPSPAADYSASLPLALEVLFDVVTDEAGEDSRLDTLFIDGFGSLDGRTLDG